MKEEGIEFVAGHEPSKGLEPTDRTFDDPPFTIASEPPTVLGWRANASLAMWADQLNVAISQTFTQRIAIRSAVIDEPSGNEGCDCLIQKRLDESNFRGASALDVDRQRQAGAVDQEHELGSLAPLGRTDQIAPFFAGANVPSAKTSCQSSWPSSSSSDKNARQMASHTPASSHSYRQPRRVGYRLAVADASIKTMAKNGPIKQGVST